MNINFCYKGQTVSTKADRKFSLKRIYESVLPKFEPHHVKELSLFGTNCRLRSRQTNSQLNFTDIIGERLQENDTINIEPRETLTSGSPNIHAPKRYDMATIESNYSQAAFKPSDYYQPKNNIGNNMYPKISSKYTDSMVNRSSDNGYRYQKSEHVNSKGSHHLKNAFDRNDLRRSLGASVAPQYDTQAYSTNRADNSGINYDSDSSVSDFNNLVNHRFVQRHAQSKSDDHERFGSLSKSCPASPTKPIPPIRSPHTHMSMLNAYNVRTIGNRINISIVKKPDFGFGFTIVTRDNPVLYGSTTDVSNSVVILVNKILANGGAALDNRLRPGDRLLELNGTPFTSHKDVMERLRAVPENQTVNLLISRVERCESPTKEELQTSIVTSSQPQQITFDIPLNQHQKVRAQLGINIHYLDDGDYPPLGPGIYIHSILPDSLASQQGGLYPGDKIIGINDRNLDNVSLDDTYGHLKRAMQTEPVLSLTVCRTFVSDQTQAYSNNNNKETQKKDNNFYLLPNKLTLDKAATRRSDIYKAVGSSHYSSSDSLPYQTDRSPAFVRESKGRRSMSNKRKAHEDATQYSFYQQTRVGEAKSTDDRLYYTLPSASRLKKMSANDPPCLPNKTPVPVKPSQMKQLNTSKPQSEHPVKAPKVPSRSMSLRTSPTRLNQRAPDQIQSPRYVSPTPTNDIAPAFNRAMNNSFKKAVQKSLPESEPYPGNSDWSPDQECVARRESVKSPHQLPPESQYLLYTIDQNKDRIPRANSVKTNDEKRMNFNLKTFLTYTPNLNRTKSSLQREKNSTLPLNEPPFYNAPSVKSGSKNLFYSPIQITPEVQPYEDPIIVDSTKRVLEWQLKNDDVISKEDMMKEHKQYQNKPEVNHNIRAPTSNKNFIYSGQDVDPYDTIDVISSSPSGVSKSKFIHSKPTRSNSHFSNDLVSPKNGVASHNNKITYQITNSHPTAQNDVYATINKPMRKDSKTHKEAFGASQSHANKYRF